MNKISAMMVATLVSLFMGCTSTDQLLKELRIKELTLERDSLSEAQAWLINKPTRQQQGDLILFVGTDILDRILRGAENMEFALASQQNVKIKIEAVRTKFRDAFPLIEVVAVATAPGWFGPLTLDLSVSAVLDLDTIFLYAPDTRARIKVLKVVPKVRYLVFRSDIQDAINAIVSTEAATYAEHLPEFTVPLEKYVPIDIPATDHYHKLEFPDTGWNLWSFVSSPAFRRNVVLNVFQVLVLQNGVYVFARISIEKP